MTVSPDLHSAAAAAWPGQEVLFYDGQCRWCTRLSRSAEPALQTRGICIAPFPDGAGEEEIKLVNPSGGLLGGVDAVLAILARWPLLRPVAWLCRRPVLHGLLTRLYRKVAVSRHCLNAACAVGASPPFSVRVMDTAIHTAAEALRRIYPPESDDMTASGVPPQGRVAGGPAAVTPPTASPA